MKYVVGENCAGYLPVGDPVVFSDEEKDDAIEYFLSRLNDLYLPHPRPTKNDVAHGFAANDGYSLRFTTPEGRDMEVWIIVED